MSKTHFVVRTRKGAAPFRRVGMTFTGEDVVVDPATLSADQLEQLRAEMKAAGSPLEVREVSGPPPATPAKGKKAAAGAPSGDGGSGEPDQPNTEDALNRQSSGPPEGGDKTPEPPKTGMRGDDPPGAGAALPNKGGRGR